MPQKLPGYPARGTDSPHQSRAAACGFLSCGYEQIDHRDVPKPSSNEPHNLLQSANAVLTHLWREVKSLVCRVIFLNEIPVDLAHIHPGATFKAGALALPPGVTLVTDAEEVIVTAHVESETPAATVLKRQKPKSWSGESA